MLLRAGRTKRLVLRNAGEKVIWSSSDIRVATVTDEGLVIAWGSGKCDITASFREKTYRCRVTVCENKKTYRYHRLRKRIKPKKNRGKIVLAGSSAIKHWKSASKAFAPYEVLNMGIGGSKVWQWLEWYEDLIVAYDPSAVILFPGTRNEIARKHSCEMTTSNVCELLELLQLDLPDVPIYYIGVYGNYKQQENWPLEKLCNEEVREFCRELENVYYIDVTGVLMDGDIPKPGVISDDGVHMDSMGYELWNEAIVPVVKRALKRNDW